jgi:hypothetical protein
MVAYRDVGQKQRREERETRDKKKGDKKIY